MGRVGKLLKTAIEKFIVQTVETRLGLNQTAVTYSSSGDDSPPLKDDRIILVKVDGTGRYAAVGVLSVSQGANPGEKIFYSRDAEGEVQAKISLLNDGIINMESPADIVVAAEGNITVETKKEAAIIADENITIGTKKDVAINADGNVIIDGTEVKINGGGEGAARKGDQVKVQIPAGAVIISVSGGSGAAAVGVPNPNPIDCMGTIQVGSSSVEIGG